ncbi:uncharacterized protein LOC135924347 [Gordionus sp. m RMFG-2023]|uniref:uncharacterized protein LOC135924347 n=1 Tax=Gordionus sp. m RMFG-2023 TaxID=3053472 RepID=UPI0031FC515F
MALRGHRDSGCIFKDDTNENDENFRAILETGDDELRINLLNAPKNATYLSPTIQNEIIDVCYNLILRKVVANINKSSFFSVLADESTDISGIEQMSLYEVQIKEDFLQFIPIQDMRGTIAKVYDMFKYPKRSNVLENILRWILPHESDAVFLKLFDPIIVALNEIWGWTDTSVVAEANEILKSIQGPEFLLAINCINTLFCHTILLCRALQRVNQDMVQALILTEDAYNAILQIRKNADCEFRTIFNKIKERLLNHKLLLSNFQILLSSNPSVNISDDIRNKIQMDIKPDNALNALNICKQIEFPNITKLFQILACLPITTCTNERTFSNLRRLKTYLRYTTSQNRINGLALLNIHRELTPDNTKIINKLSNSKRKLDITL